ncbi:Uncharacterised protein [Mycobacterium tuberculosis]|uniref:Uncharacterized protein n=1 Tax=Mycobacterium tuberculosis TaxID=1773 RepID=A0A916LBH1_MYCTX|nr:Uncharacterised protein [Mycobacterium tuberculosis]
MNSSGRGTVWMTSSSNWPGWLGSLSAIASASRTRREIVGISSTSAFMAATLKSPTKRCSTTLPSTYSRTAMA